MPCAPVGRYEAPECRNLRCSFEAHPALQRGLKQLLCSRPIINVPPGFPQQAAECLRLHALLQQEELR